jgi:hypothetical protein
MVQNIAKVAAVDQLAASSTNVKVLGLVNGGRQVRTGLRLQPFRFADPAHGWTQQNDSGRVPHVPKPQRLR